MIAERDNPQPRLKPGPKDGAPALPCPTCGGRARCERPALRIGHSKCCECGFEFTEPARELHHFRIEAWREGEWQPVPLGEMRATAKVNRVDSAAWVDHARIARWLETSAREFSELRPGESFRVAEPGDRRATLAFGPRVSLADVDR